MTKVWNQPESNEMNVKVHISSVCENFKSLVAGGVGGVCAVLTGQPFDLLKVRCQSNQANGVIDGISKILAESRRMKGYFLLNSVKNFYKGVIPPLLGVTPIFAISFWGYDISKKIIAHGNMNNDQLSVSQLAMAGFISAIPTTLVTTPTERIKVVLQTSSTKSVYQAVRNIINNGGIFSVFKGFSATLARDGPGSALYFAAYEVSKKYLNGDNNKELSIGNICISGGIAGISMWIGVFPIDTIKTQLQSSNVKQSMWEATKNIYKNSGIRGFFPGIAPALMRSFPANAATFLGVEITHSLFKTYNI